MEAPGPGNLGRGWESPDIPTEGSGMGTESSGMIPSLSWSSDIPGKRHEGRFWAGDGNHGISGAGSAGIIVDPTPGPARTSQNSRPVPGSVFQAFLELWKPRECRHSQGSRSGARHPPDQESLPKILAWISSSRSTGLDRPKSRDLAVIPISVSWRRLPGFPDASSKEFFPA